MKLGVSYIVFDGVELLENSINQIRNFVDYIQVIYQKVSWFGIDLNDGDMDLLRDLESKKIIEELSLFSSFKVVKEKNDSSIMSCKLHEARKRQFGLESCLKNKCTHHLCMDVDEFYIPEEFKKAKEKIIKNNYSQTAVSFINYVHLPTIHRGFDKKKVPFICEINNQTKISTNFFVKCDKTRGLTKTNNGKQYLFDKSEIFMHHMETVRKNLFNKYNSTTRKIFNREKIEELVQKIKSVDNDSKTINFENIINPKLGELELSFCKNIFNINIYNYENF